MEGVKGGKGRKRRRGGMGTGREKGEAVGEEQVHPSGGARGGGWNGGGGGSGGKREVLGERGTGREGGGEKQASGGTSGIGVECG